MEKQSKILIVALVVVAAAVAALLLQPRVEERLAPEITGALVAIEPAGSGVAVVGRVDLGAAEDFVLRAVLTATSRDGEPVYYTEASRLIVDGKEVPRESLRPWDRGGVVKVRWFTVEGSRRLVTLEDASLNSFEIRPFLRGDWPLTWSIPGELSPAHDDHLVAEAQQGDWPFGTQRYRVQVEFYASDTTVVPERSVASPGVSELRQAEDEFPTVVSTLPGALGPASRFFGLTQIEPPAGAPRELLQRIEELAQRELAFSRLNVVHDQLAAAGLEGEEVDWGTVDLSGTAAWGRDVGPGDLLRAGERVVVLFEDQGQPGVLDPADLCFDFVQGPVVAPLAAVYSGGGDGELQHVAIARRVVGEPVN